MKASAHPSPVISRVLPDDGLIPNNALPVLIYTQAIQLPATAPDDAVEELVCSNQWAGVWRDSVYAYHHYHSTAHEVLVVCAGRAELQLGGPRGVVETVRAGDVLILPAGVGHMNRSSSDDFLVIGAYPVGQQWDMCYGKASERPRADENIARVPLPKSDPVYGPNGPLLEHWRRP